MVAPAATTSPSNPALQSGDPSSPWPSSASLGHSVTLSLLSDLASPHHSLASVAEKHGLTLDTLLAWLALPSTREHMALHESAAYSHVRYVGALNLSHAVHTTVKTLETFNATPRPADPLDPGYLRASIHARKAAWLLYRFSRLTPLTDADIAAARNTLRATRAAEAPTARVPRVTAEPLGREPEPAPHNASPSPRATTPLPTAHSPSSISTTPAPSSPRPSASPAFQTSPPERHAAPLAAGAPLSLEELTAHLEALAASLGIDVSDLDDPNFDAASFFSHPPDPALALATPDDTT